MTALVMAMIGALTTVTPASASPNIGTYSIFKYCYTGTPGVYGRMQITYETHASGATSIDYVKLKTFGGAITSGAARVTQWTKEGSTYTKTGDYSTPNPPGQDVTYLTNFPHQAQTSSNDDNWYSYRFGIFAYGNQIFCTSPTAPPSPSLRFAANPDQ